MNVTNEPLLPSRLFTEMLGEVNGSLIIINIIRTTRSVIRFGQLAAASIPNISRKVLTDQLKSLRKGSAYF